MGCINLQSLSNKTPIFVESVLNDQYDLLVVIETWLKENDTVVRTMSTPSSYMLRDHIREGRMGGGIGLLCKEVLNPKLIKCGEHLSYSFAEYSFKFSNENFLLFIVYRPPYSENNPVTVNTFFTEFDTHLEALIDNNVKLLIVGDFNIHVNNSSDTNTLKFKDLLDTYGLTNNIDFPTHMGGNTLDLIITRTSDNIQPQYTEPTSYISDHCFVRAIFNIKKPPPQTRNVTYRKLDNINIDNLKQDILQSELSTIGTKNTTIHEDVIIYDNTLINLINIHAPEINKTIRVKPESPWYNGELMHLKLIKRDAERKWKKSKTVENYNHLKLTRNNYVGQCNRAHKSYHSSLVEDCGNDQGKLYKLINKLTFGNKNIPYPDINTNTLVNNFGNYFQNKVHNIINDIDCIIENENILEVVNYEELETDIPSLNNFTQLSTNQVKKLIMEASTKTCKLDPIPTSTLKKCLDTLITPITNIVNKSLVSGSFPEKWKTGVVIPLLKKT